MCPRPEELVEGPPNTSEIPDQSWPHQSNIIVRPNSPAESSSLETDSCITTLLPQNDSLYENEPEDHEQLDQGESSALTGPAETEVVPYDRIMTGWDEVPQIMGKNETTRRTRK